MLEETIDIISEDQNFICDKNASDFYHQNNVSNNISFTYACGAHAKQNSDTFIICDKFNHQNLNINSLQQKILDETKVFKSGSTATMINTHINQNKIIVDGCFIGDSPAYLIAYNKQQKECSLTAFFASDTHRRPKNSKQDLSLTHALGNSSLTNITREFVGINHQLDYDDNHEYLILVCSDGLTDRLKDEEIAKICATHWGNPTKIHQTLKESSKSKGGKFDDTTILIAKPTNEPCFLAVFDGHNGREAAAKCREICIKNVFPEMVQKHSQITSPTKAQRKKPITNLMSPSTSPTKDTYSNTKRGILKHSDLNKLLFHSVTEGKMESLKMTNISELKGTNLRGQNINTKPYDDPIIDIISENIPADALPQKKKILHTITRTQSVHEFVQEDDKWVEKYEKSPSEPQEKKKLSSSFVDRENTNDNVMFKKPRFK